MTYGQHPTCRRGGCGQPVAELDNGILSEWCAAHLQEIQQVRAKVVVAAKPGASHR